MKEVDIEGFKITVKNMTMLARSTTVKSKLLKFKYPSYTHSKVKNLISICINITYYKFNSISYTHFRSKRLILKGTVIVGCPEHDHVNMVNHGQQSTKK